MINKKLLLRGEFTRAEMVNGAGLDTYMVFPDIATQGLNNLILYVQNNAHIVANTVGCIFLGSDLLETVTIGNHTPFAYQDWNLDTSSDDGNILSYNWNSIVFEPFTDILSQDDDVPFLEYDNLGADNNQLADALSIDLPYIPIRIDLGFKTLITQTNMEIVFSLYGFDG